MNINEVLQGMSNLGGETPRVTKPKRIKEIIGTTAKITFRFIADKDAKKQSY